MYCKTWIYFTSIRPVKTDSHPSQRWEPFEQQSSDRLIPPSVLSFGHSSPSRQKIISPRLPPLFDVAWNFHGLRQS
jgi:hypothetical protein